MDIKAVLDEILAVDPSAPAIEYKRCWTSWGDLARAKAAVDEALAAAGLGAGAAVGVLLRSNPASVAAMLGVVFSGRCQVVLNPMLPPEKLFADIRKTRPSALIGEPSDWAAPGLVEVANEVGCLGLVVTVGETQPVQVVPGLEAVRGGGHHPPAPGVAIEMLTSGTTGAPKRVPLEYASLEAALTASMVYERGRTTNEPARLRRGVIISHTPLVHTFGYWNVLTALLGGRQLCLLERFTVPDWLDAVARHKPKVASLPPACLRMVLDAQPDKEQLASLVALRSGTAPLPPETADEFLERYNIPVLENYGATEFAGGVAGWTIEDFRAHWRDKRGSVGRLNADVEARIVDAQDFSVLPFGAEGLLELRARQFGRDFAWVRTTDRAVLDADRFLWINGRADNAIIRGGFKVHPEDVVSALERHPAVREACVIGLPDRRLGEVPVAAIVLKSDAPAPTHDELSAFLRKHLTAYQIPVAYKLMAELPRTPSMKVSQPALKELFAADFPG